MMNDFDWVGTMGVSPVFITLVACSVLTLAVAIERTLFYRKRRDFPSAAQTRILDLVRRGQRRDAERACRETLHPFGPVAVTLLTNDPPASSPEERIGIALSEQQLVLEKNLGFLNTMAAAAPLIGLLGTVVGIMRAFHDMSRVGNAAPAVVAAGVAEALVTTAAGLVVAVPAVMLYNHFARRASTMLTVAENGARILRAVLVEREADVPAAAPDVASRPERELAHAR
jgi:biopolymer transport protein ExbB